MEINTLFRKDEDQKEYLKNEEQNRCQNSCFYKFIEDFGFMSAKKLEKEIYLSITNFLELESRNTCFNGLDHNP